MTCDLHLHSSASDGTDAPEDLPRLARAKGLQAIALTDHDTTAGIPACAAAAKAARIQFVPGIELSADPASIDPNLGLDAATGRPTGTLHILGYFIRHDDPALARVQARLRTAREQRNPEMVERLNEVGVRITYDEVLAAAGADAGKGTATIVGRPHIAQVMVQKGYVKSIHEAFNHYLREGGLAYVRKDRLSAQAAIDAIHAAGGLAFLAHPTQLRLPDADTLEHAVRRLKSLGIDGIETLHSDHTPAETERFERLARKAELLISGGSDYHGSRKSVTLGQMNVPRSVFDDLLAAHAARTTPSRA